MTKGTRAMEPKAKTRSQVCRAAFNITRKSLMHQARNPQPYQPEAGVMPYLMQSGPGDNKSQVFEISSESHRAFSVILSAYPAHFAFKQLCFLEIQQALT